MKFPAAMRPKRDVAKPKPRSQRKRQRCEPSNDGDDCLPEAHGTEHEVQRFEGDIPDDAYDNEHPNWRGSYQTEKNITH